MPSSSSKEKEARAYIKDRVNSTLYFLFVVLIGILVLVSLGMSFYAFLFPYLNGNNDVPGLASLVLASLSFALYLSFLSLEFIYKRGRTPFIHIAMWTIRLLSLLFLLASSLGLIASSFLMDEGSHSFLFSVSLVLAVLLFLFSLVDLYFLLWRLNNKERYLFPGKGEEEKGNVPVKRK